MKTSSWEGVADWYNDLLKDDSSYQKNVVLPNLLRVVNPKPDEKIIDIACGQGFFAREISKTGAKITACDISPELIKIAKSSSAGISYFVSEAHNLKFAKDSYFDKAIMVLALQNIKNLSGVIEESARILVPGGKIFIVLNHPSFRIPKASSWGWDENGRIQYRRIDAYMSEREVKIDMTPGSKNSKKFTVSFHRPLQVYVKALAKNKLYISRLEEWISNKKSNKGPRKIAEDISRKEIPLFMCLEVEKMLNE